MMSLVSFKRSFSKVKKEDIVRFVSNNKLLLLLSVFLLIGVFLGAILVRFTDENIMKFINVLFITDFKERLSKTLLSIFIASISSIFIFIIMSFFMGLSIWGFIVAPLVPFIRGVCIGLSEGYLYSTYGLRGICFYSLVFLPGIFISSIAILLMTREAIKLSNDFSSLIFLGNKLTNVRNSIRLYIIRSGCVAIIVIIASVADIVSNVLFSKLFKF